MTKVVSLLPAATEIVCAIGACDSLVGISHECDFPEVVNDLPRVTHSRISLDLDSAAIQESVVHMVEQALSIYHVDSSALSKLVPDVIVTQDLCEVCAVSYDDVCSALENVAGDKKEIVRLHPLTLEDIFQDIITIGDALSRSQQAEILKHSLQQRLNALSERVTNYSKKTVLMLEWLHPVMIGGLWSAQLANYCGASALASQVGEHAVTLGLPELEQIDPDVVLIKPCGYSIEKTIAEIEILPQVLPWQKWSAVKSGQVYLVDGSTYFNRSGPRIVDSAEILAVCIHGKLLEDLANHYSDKIRRIKSDLSVVDI